MKPINKQIKIGDHYIDCGYIPRICLEIDGGSIKGKSLIDNSIGFCSIRYCAPEWVHEGVAQRWAKTGPLSKNLKEHLKSFYNGEWGNGRKIWWKE